MRLPPPSDRLAAEARFHNHSSAASPLSGRRYQVYIDDRSRRPGVALVNRIAMLVDLKRTIEMRAFFNWTFAVIFDASAPENGLAVVVGGFEFEPCVVGIDGAAGKEVADFLGSNDNIDSHSVTAAQRGAHSIERRRNRSGFGRGGSNFGFGFFAHRKRRCRV